MTFDRAASAAIVRQRAARRWFRDAHECAACLLVSREHPPTADIDDEPSAPAARPSKKPRHRALSLDGLRIWFDMNSSSADWPVADNDNTPRELRGPAGQRQVEASLDFYPSEEQMLAAIAGAEPARDGARVTFGGLRFDHGRLTWWRSSAVEAWRRPTEKYGARPGTTKGATGSDRAVRAWMAADGEWQEEPHRRLPLQSPQPGWPVRGAGRDWLDVASPSAITLTAGTRPVPRPASNRNWLMVAHVPVPVMRCPGPALPTVGALHEQFSTGRCRPSGQAVPGGPELARQEAAIICREETAAVEKLAPQDRRVLEAATKARTMADIGAIAGLSGKAAERAGSKMLVEASKNLHEVLLAA